MFGALISDDVANQDTFLEWPARCYAISATAIRVESNAAPFYDLDEADTGLTPAEMIEVLSGVYSSGNIVGSSFNAILNGNGIGFDETTLSIEDNAGQTITLPLNGLISGVATFFSVATSTGGDVIEGDVVCTTLSFYVVNSAIPKSQINTISIIQSNALFYVVISIDCVDGVVNFNVIAQESEESVTYYSMLQLSGIKTII